MIQPLASLLGRVRASLWLGARQAMLRLMLVATATALGATGAAFLIASAYQGLVDVLGPALGALATGTILLLGSVSAAIVALRRTTPPSMVTHAPTPASPFTADGLAAAVFALAFTLGRQIPRRNGRTTAAPRNRSDQR